MIPEMKEFAEQRKAFVDFIEGCEDPTYFMLMSVPGRAFGISLTMFNKNGADASKVAGEVLKLIQSYPDKKVVRAENLEDKVAITFDNNEQFMFFNYSQGVIDCGL